MPLTNFYVVFYSCAFLQFVIGEQPINIKLNDLFKMQEGLGWPKYLTVTEGHDALMKLKRSLENEEHCIATMPNGLTFNLNSPPNDRYKAWSDGCGMRIQSVMKSDEGRWRLTSLKGSDNYTGWIEVDVQKDASISSISTPISLIDGQTNAEVELTDVNNAYCIVTQPFAESSLLPGHCRVTLERTTRAVQGNWNILLGIPGKVAESHVEKHVMVEAERLNVGYIHDVNENKLHLYCNILHSSKIITFCRFQKTGRPSGYNVAPGLSDGNHSYYGEGFLKQQCGMTVEHPSEQHYGTWRCSVGVEQLVDSHIVPQSPMQALISVAPNTRNLRMTRNSDVEDDVKTIFVQMDQSFTITCRANSSLRYCWFQHPNGTQYTPVQLVNEEQLFWYTGASLQIGDCGIVFAHVTIQDAGEWKCHMGSSQHTGLEVTERVIVRVTGSLAANRKEIKTAVGGKAVLYCHTSNRKKPLDYCRFLSPNFVGISVDSSITEENPILNRYYFTPERNLDYGDCSLTINPVYEEDIGEWTCAALVNEDSVESRDSIRVYMDASAARYRAGIIGISTSSSILVLAVIGYVVWLKRDKLFSRRRGESETAGIAVYGRQSTGSNES